MPGHNEIMSTFETAFGKMESIDVKRIDASNDFKNAFVNNVELNGLENTMTQFKALANVYSTDFFIDVTAQPTQGLEN